MSARSFLLSALLFACSSKPSAPEADPAKIQPIVTQMFATAPAPAAVRECEGTEVIGGFTMTAATLMALANKPLPDRPEYAEWVNPHELDAPAARTLIDANASAKAKRQAAAEMLAAPFYLVYRVDLVNAPLALQVKELKRGTVGGRAIRYDKTGTAVCVRLFDWENSKEKSDWAIAQTNKALVDPKVAREVQLDLRTEMLKRVSKLALPPEPAEPMPRIPDGISN